MISRTGFSAPDFDAPTDVVAQKRLVPSGATVKGMQLQALADLCAKAGKPVEKRFVGFRDYPGDILVDLLVDSARRCYPLLPTREGMRRLGLHAYPTLASSLVGRVVFGLVKIDVGALLGLVSRGYSLSGSHGSAVVLERDETAALLRLEGIYTFVDAWHVGIVEGAGQAVGRDIRILVKLRAKTSADFLIEW